MTPIPILARPALIEIVDDDDGALTACITPLRVVRPKRYSDHGADASPVAFEVERR